MATETVPAKITSELVKRMDELVKKGLYCSRSELVRDAVRRLIGEKEIEKAPENKETEDYHRMIR